MCMLMCVPVYVLCTCMCACLCISVCVHVCMCIPVLYFRIDLLIINLCVSYATHESIIHGIHYSVNK